MTVPSQSTPTKQPVFPKFDEFIWTTVEALRTTGGSATNQEIEKFIIESLAVKDEVLEFRSGTGQNVFRRKCAWARSYLKQAGALENSESAVWALTQKGKELTRADIAPLKRLVDGLHRQRRTQASEIEDSQKEEIDEDAATAALTVTGLTWQEEVIEVLHSLTPAAFERLCQRILRESGFVQVDVLGKTGDGGIDGRGVLRLGLISFHVLFQCKRYKGSVGPGEIRDFRGAMSGRTDKGLFITTGTFTSSAVKEANREGTAPIELIDGEELAAVLKRLKLGVQSRLVEEVTVDNSFFTEI